MASLCKDRNKAGDTLWRILIALDGKRQPIHLGQMPKRQAEGILRHIEQLASCRRDSSAPPEQTAVWLADVDATLRARLMKLGLAAALAEPEPAKPVLTVGTLIASYRATPAWKRLKPNTKVSKDYAFKLLKDHFGENHAAEEITSAGARGFYDQLLLPVDQGGQGYAVATANTTVANIHALWGYAIDDEKLERNPFRKVPRTSRKGNNSHVSASDSLKVLEEMPGTQGTLLFGLARWAGVRMPSEPKKLRWCDIDREREMMLIHAPKTERHEGRATRWVPIFPELKPLIQARYDEAEPGEEYVLPCLSGSAQSKATKMLKSAIKRAGVTPWPRLFHSLRATRQTELQRCNPSHVVCAILGNTEDVAQKHYLIVTDDDLQRAAHNQAQYVAASTRETPQASVSADSSTAELQADAV